MYRQLENDKANDLCAAITLCPDFGFIFAAMRIAHLASAAGGLPHAACDQTCASHPSLSLVHHVQDDDEDGGGGNTEAGGKRAAAEAEQRLRMYERAKLRRHFAVAEFDAAATAARVYDECDGHEFQESAVCFDLRFVPEEEDFSGRQIRDEARGVPEGYEPPAFKSQALQHTKPKLTWDADDAARAKALSRQVATADDLKDDDFKAYLASDSGSGSEGDDEGPAPEGGGSEDPEAIRARCASKTLRASAFMPAWLARHAVCFIWGRTGELAACSRGRNLRSVHVDIFVVLQVPCTAAARRQPAEHERNGAARQEGKVVGRRRRGRRC
jgi:hypothetical protein